MAVDNFVALIRGRSAIRNVVAPFLSKVGNRDALITGHISGLFGSDKWRGFWLDNPAATEDFELDSITKTVEPSPGNDGDLLRFLLADRWLDMGGTGRMSMALRASIDFSAFQLRPLLKFFGDSNRRVLIADETGLGKTIEAGMILTEILAAKGPDSCIVILCPASVQWKWIWELRTKFGVRAWKSDFRKFNSENAPSGVHVITHSVSREESSLDLQSESIDLLIIDEIHNFIGRTEGQKRRGRAMSLSLASKGVIGLSATPVQLEANDLRLILELIAPGEHGQDVWSSQARIQTAVNRIMTAQTNDEGAELSDIQEIRNHWPDTTVNPDELLEPLSKEKWAEIELDIRAIGPIGRRMTRARGRDPDVNNFRERIVNTQIVEQTIFANVINEVTEFISANMYWANQQQFASCPSAFLRVLNNLPPSDELYRIIHLVQNEMANDGPKFSALLGLLNDLSTRNDVTKTVVFTHWHPTFYQLRDLIGLNGFSVFSVNPKSAESIDASNTIQRFEECEGYAVLLVTDKMSEGIDLHMANTMINMDLPYNPAKLQQRIGRLDRYIQESKFIEVYNLVLEGTHEIRQVDVLSARMNVFGEMVGEYEAILTTNDKEATIDSQEGEIASLLESRDTDKLAESNVILRVMDSALDGQIGERQRELHPVHSRLHLIIQNALQRIGAQTNWDEESGEIQVEMSEDLRRAILNSKTFIPWGDGRVRAAFERVDDKGFVVLKMRGRHATMGPLDPFIAACESILWSIEGMNDSSDDSDQMKLIGSKDNHDRWQIIDDGEISITSGQDIISQITAGALLLGNWNINESNITNCVKNK